MSGVEWSGVEWSGVEWSGVEWSGVERSGVEWRVACGVWRPAPLHTFSSMRCIVSATATPDYVVHMAHGSYLGGLKNSPFVTWKLAAKVKVPCAGTTIQSVMHVWVRAPLVVRPQASLISDAIQSLADGTSGEGWVDLLMGKGARGYNAVAGDVTGWCVSGCGESCKEKDEEKDDEEDGEEGAKEGVLEEEEEEKEEHEGGHGVGEGGDGDDETMHNSGGHEGKPKPSSNTTKRKKKGKPPRADPTPAKRSMNKRIAEK